MGVGGWDVTKLGIHLGHHLVARTGSTISTVVTVCAELVQSVQPVHVRTVCTVGTVGTANTVGTLGIAGTVGTVCTAGTVIAVGTAGTVGTVGTVGTAGTVETVGTIRIVHNQFTSYLQLNDRLTKAQSGNKKWHSTETSVIETTDTILRAIDQKMFSSAVLFTWARPEWMGESLL